MERVPFHLILFVLPMTTSHLTTIVVLNLFGEEHPFLFSFDEEMVKIIPEIQILAHILKHLKNGT